jgi:hypothetical protein
VEVADSKEEARRAADAARLKALLMANPLDVAAVVAALPEAGALALLAKVAQGSKRRAENRLRVLLALGDTPSHPLAAEADAQVLAVLERVGAEGT